MRKSSSPFFASPSSAANTASGRGSWMGLPFQTDSSCHSSRNIRKDRAATNGLLPAMPRRPAQIANPPAGAWTRLSTATLPAARREPATSVERATFPTALPPRIERSLMEVYL